MEKNADLIEANTQQANLGCRDTRDAPPLKTIVHSILMQNSSRGGRSTIGLNSANS